jgi:hypothetical protein
VTTPLMTLVPKTGASGTVMPLMLVVPPGDDEEVTTCGTPADAEITRGGTAT